VPLRKRVEKRRCGVFLINMVAVVNDKCFSYTYSDKFSSILLPSKTLHVIINNTRKL
jgi:hypothetical protein